MDKQTVNSPPSSEDVTSSKWVGTAAAATELRRTQQHVRDLVHRGVLAASTARDGRQMLISRADLDAYKATLGGG
jgi:excisionase family DNA binding protein